MLVFYTDISAFVFALHFTSHNFTHKYGGIPIFILKVLWKIMKVPQNINNEKINELIKIIR